MQELAEIEAILLHSLSVTDESSVNSLRSHPPQPPF
jgi:hypothetical protein